jgi:ATP-dependent DNA helicase RecQ
MPEATELARKILSCVARVGQRFGVGHVVQVLRGAETETVRRLGHDRLSTYGLLTEVPEKTLTNLVYQLVDQGLLERTSSDRPVLTLSGDSLDVLRGRREVRLVEPKGRPVSASRPEAESWEGVDRDLFEELRALRRTLARQRSVPPYVIFSDATLRELARVRPTDLPTMSTVRGVGQKKLADFGPVVIEAVAAHAGRPARSDHR